MPAPYHIIIADDDPVLRTFLPRAVARIYPDVTISAVQDGAEALSIYQQQGADLLIADRAMSVMGGLALVRTLRAEHAALPIVLASSDPDFELLALAAGATRFLSKPFTMTQLRQVLMDLLPQASEV